MIRWAWGIILMLLMLSCGPREEKLSLEEEKMIQVLADVHLAEAAMQNTSGPVKDSIAEVYYRQIYEIHDLSEQEFEENMRILRRNPKIL
ncbi:MAG: DUF4296 domain-containing protein, partial [Saprospiraceae bacterium]|nr:DUF4296 domain-containing protein [Saprospiraceae bacterium]